MWGVQEYLLALAVDLLGAGNWQRGAGKGQRWKPVKRPGATNEKRYGKAIPIEVARERRRQREARLAAAG